MSDTFRFLPLGGAAEIGMNLNLYAYNDAWLMVDLGVSFNDNLGIDVIMPNPQYIVERRAQLCGLVLTHAHEDHIGAVPYLWPQLQCPIYATPFTAHILRGKLEDAGLIDQVTIHEVPLSGTVNIGPFKVEMISLTHSIPEPNGLLIETPLGRVFHTGDWKIDPTPLVGEDMDVEKLKAIGKQGVLAMVCDSTNIYQEKTAGSEKDVRDALMDVVEKYKDHRIFVTCFASNVARLHSIATVAKALGRPVVRMGRSIKRYEEAARQHGYMKGLPPFLDIRDVDNTNDKNYLFITTGSQGEGRAALKRIADDQYPGIAFAEDDVVIFSSRVIPGNEKRIGFLKNSLIRKGVHLITQHAYDIHVSGHPSRSDLRQMYDWIKPKIAIPVHGELRHMIEHGKLARQCGVEEIVIAENGTLVEMAPEIHVIDEVPTGRLALEGGNVIRMDHTAIRERGKLSNEGVVSVSVVLEDLLDVVDIQLEARGIVNTDNVFGLAHEAIKQNLEVYMDKEAETVEGVREFVQGCVRRVFRKIAGKRPLVMVHVVNMS